MTTFCPGILLGFLGWFFLRYVIRGFYTVDQNERAVKTRFGRAVRLSKSTTLDDPISEALNEKDRERYSYPLVRVIPPGGPYFRWPWEKIHKVSVATETINMALDLETPDANHAGTELDAVTKDQLNIGLTGQIRYRPCERNLYAYLFGVKTPIVHVMAYFISILRQRIASFESQAISSEEEVIDVGLMAGISINDLRKNLNEINNYMELECASAAARYGVELDASLITGIDPPSEVESALAAINTAHNEVSSEISLAKAQADQTIVQSKRAVEIETLRAQAEVEPLTAMAEQLRAIKSHGPEALDAYLRNVRLALYTQAKSIILEVEE
ncbi:MAG: SPFH domain-containing protein [Chloroflexi bacterium]|nr:SPFH domain-containing protein [Chloroflexota bacterium]MBK6709000.1 SPFH domain-containing protein [Chloroflexota bacterium]MBK7175831.1 SPFH domain-containing protein [Chloroflexota bacterium]MBK7914778.1 SPFH domain-containing protein [Chloroflexota bacterium]MBK8936037.1 SPFH domain-containing protein [Chloroflexota bacterium]